MSYLPYDHCDECGDDLENESDDNNGLCGRCYFDLEAVVTSDPDREDDSGSPCSHCGEDSDSLDDSGFCKYCSDYHDFWDDNI